MKLQSRFSILWVLWVAAFAVIEGVALFNTEEGDTLSEHVYQILDLSPASEVVLATFLSWLAIHWLSRGKV